MPTGLQHVTQPQYPRSALPMGEATLMSRVNVLVTGSIPWFRVNTRY